MVMAAAAVKVGAVVAVVVVGFYTSLLPARVLGCASGRVAIVVCGWWH